VPLMGSPPMPDVAPLVNVTGCDADAAATVGAFAETWSDEARAVWSDEASLATLSHDGFDLHHVHDGDAFGDGDGELKLCVHCFEDCVCGEWRRNEDGTGSCASLFRSLSYGVKDGHLHAIVLEGLSALTGSDSCYELGAVIKAEARVTASEAACDSLNQDLSVFVY